MSPAQVRRGVQPGSFIDLLMRAKDKTTGKGFTDMEIANQVSSAHCQGALTGSYDPMFWRHQGLNDTQQKSAHAGSCSCSYGSSFPL